MGGQVPHPGGWPISDSNRKTWVPHISILRCGHSRKARTRYAEIILRTPGGQKYDWLLFTSANAVEAFHNRQKVLDPSKDQKVLGPSKELGAPCPDSRTWVSDSHEHPSPSPTPIPKVAVIGPATLRAANAIVPSSQTRAAAPSDPSGM